MNETIDPKREGPARTLFAADWVLPVASSPIAEGAVLTEGATITRVGRARDLRAAGVDQVVELAGCLLMPGLVNAHTHLELSFLKGRLRPAESFAAWVEALVGELLGTEEAEFAEAVRSGLVEGLESGITAVGDISRTGLSWPLLAEAGLKGTVFLELLGFHPVMEREELSKFSAALEGMGAQQATARRVGITPHAPYSTSPRLYREASRLARQNGLPVALHVAETLEEELFVREAQGPFREMLERFGLWSGEFTPQGCSSVAYLGQLGVLQGALAVHCNTVDDQDISALKAAGARVAFCPGSNAWFGRSPRHRLPKLLEAGVGCALGTDSLASNSRLDLLAEMGICAEAHPELDLSAVLRLATLGAAEAIGLAEFCGSLEAGKAADLVALRLPAAHAEEPLEWVVSEATGQDVALVMVDGAPVHRS